MPTENDFSIQQQYSSLRLPQGVVQLGKFLWNDSKATKLFFSFEQKGVVQEEEADLVFIYHGDNLADFNALPKTSQALGSVGSKWLQSLQTRGSGGIASVVITQDSLPGSFEELAECSGLTYSQSIPTPGPGIYCVRSRDGQHYAKVCLPDILLFVWVYQPNGLTDVRTELQEWRHNL